MAGSAGLEWFRPVWRRALVVGFCVVWCAWEWLLNRDTFWGVVTLFLVAYAVWTFFINFDKAAGPPPGDGPAPPPAA